MRNFLKRENLTFWELLGSLYLAFIMAYLWINDSGISHAVIVGGAFFYANIAVYRSNRALKHIEEIYKFIDEEEQKNIDAV